MKIGLVEWLRIKSLSSSPSSAKNKNKTKQNKKTKEIQNVEKTVHKHAQEKSNKFKRKN
jgi:hypothetical protein